MNIWLIVGIALLVWDIYEIITGSTWIHRKVARAKEPALFWVLVTIWGILALWAIYVGLT
ncbi:MAG: hypothetical protein AAF462_07860 [Thermodesulfobacteriota bacterium]